MVPFPHDSKKLSNGDRRVDVGEYRIIYRFDVDAQIIEVVLIGKRNDGEVYKQLKRI